MTVNTQNIRSGPYVGNGTTVEFAYTFPIQETSQVAVYFIDEFDEIFSWTLGTDYTVSGVGDDDGGVITATVAPEENQKILIISDYDATQDSEISSQGAFFPDIHEDAFDKLTMLVQQLEYKVNRSVRISDIDPDVPGISAVDNLEPLYLFQVNEAGDGVRCIPLSDVTQSIPELTDSVFGNFLTNRYTNGTDFTGDTTTTLTLGAAPGARANTWVFFDGVYQETNDYVVSGDVLTFNAAIPNSVTTVEVKQGIAVAPETPSYGVVVTKTASFAITADLAFSYVNIESGTPVTVTVLGGSGTGLDRAEVHLRQNGEGVVTIAANPGITVKPPAGGTLQMGGENATVTLKKITDTEWHLIGQVIAASS